MDTNIIVEYTDFIRRQIIDFYYIILKNKFDKKLIIPFLDKYIMVRYYNESAYPKEKDIIERIIKELEAIVKEITTPENKEQIKNIYSLFGYILYFDDCYFIEDDKELLKLFFEDQNLKIEFTTEMKEEMKNFINEFKNNKMRFNEVLSSNKFYLVEKRLKKYYYRLTLGHDVKVSSLYSESAIEKAFNTGSINEDKLSVLFVMACNLILQNAIGLDFSRCYIVDIVPSLYVKDKKIEKLFKGLDNILTQKYLILNIKYSDYLINKEKVDEFIQRGYSFAITLDDTFDEDYSRLILFSCVLLYKDHEKYDIIKENKNKIASQLITL